jgi:hypothetical protein
VKFPRFVVVVRERSERPHDAGKVMLIFKSDVLVNKLEASLDPVGSIHSGHDQSA